MRCIIRPTVIRALVPRRSPGGLKPARPETPGLRPGHDTGPAGMCESQGRFPDPKAQHSEAIVLKKTAIAAALAATAFAGTTAAQSARDYISIVGSSTVYPFATVVAEQFGKTTRFKTPKIESTGSGGGLKLFCAGVGVQHPDITNASRRIKKSEVEMCEKNGVAEITEVKVGYDGIVLANSTDARPLQLTRKDIYLALAKEIPDPSGAEELVPTPHQTGSDVNRNLPDAPLEVLGPPPTSGTR